MSIRQLFDFIPDGDWYWKIRCKDTDGDWGPYSTPFKFTIDTGIPSSEITIPKNDTYYRTLVIIYGTAFEPSGGTGLDRIEIQIEDIEALLGALEDYLTLERNAPG